MGDIIRFKRPKPMERHKGSTLCKSGFHKWEVDKAKPFDTRSGKLISRYICSRCGTVKTEGS